MSFVGRLIRSVLALSILAGIGAAVAAAIAKGRLESRGGPEDDDVDLVAIYTGLDFRSVAPAFRRGSVTAWYGGATIDLRGATLDSDGATLDVKAIFGGVRLVVPEAWHVEQHVTAFAGGVGDVRSQDAVADAGTGPTLSVRGFAVFGGVGIVSEAPDLDTVGSPELDPVLSA